MDSSFTSLLYHSVGDYKENEYDIEFEVFKNQINWLKREGYVVESIEMFNQRKNKIPEKYVILTFDDGYKSFLNAAKFLTKIGFSGTFFLTKNWCEKKSNFLDKNQIKELSKIQDVGSHSVSHPYLTKIKKNQIDFELKSSKSWLEDIIQKEIISFSSPYGFINKYIVERAVFLGYQYIATSLEVKNFYEKVNLTSCINRFAIRKDYDFYTFKKIMEQDRLFYLKKQARNVISILPKKILPEKTYLALRRLVIK